MGNKSGNGDKAKSRLNSTRLVKSKPPTQSNNKGSGLHAIVDTMGLPLSAVSSLWAIEPRILLDAAAFETADTVMASVADDHADQFFLTKTVCLPAPILQLPFVTVGHLDGPDGVAADNTANMTDKTIGFLDPVSAIEVPGPAATSLVFIDANVEDMETIIANIDPSNQIIILSAQNDGVEQIAAYLSGKTGIEAIHIIAHGTSGSLDLGNAKLSASSIAGAHADEMEIIRNALTENADILIYGCDFAAGSRGANAVSALAGATGADIAASEDLTGAAFLGGDWDLEVNEGSIEAAIISAPEWNGVLAPLTISVTTNPVLVGTTGINGLTGLEEGGVGYSALWTNAGNIGGSSIDIKATVVSLTGSTISFITQGDDASIVINGGATAVIKWEIFASGTSQTIYAIGSPNFRITDIDGVGGAPGTRETVIPQLNGLTEYTVDNPTNLNATVSGSGVTVSGTQNQNNEPTSLTAFTWQNVSSWQVSYTLNPASGFSNAVFRHDGDGDFAFNAPVTVSLLSLDLDGNNSTSPGTAYQATYTEGGPSVPVGDLADVVIAQNAVLGSNLGQATIILTDAQAGDVLTPGSLPVGITAIVDTSVAGKITVTLSGTASIAEYQTAISAIGFSSIAGTPSQSDRHLEISVTNTTFSTTSAPANATIHVLSVNDAPAGADQTIVTNEDIPYTFSVADFGFADPSDSPADSFQSVIITTLPATGTLTLSGLPVGIGQSVPVTSIGNLVWTPPVDANGPAISSFTFQVVDSGGTANGGIDTDPTPNTITFDVTAQNDPPVIDLDGDDSVTPGFDFETTFNENSPAVSITDSDAIISDVDSQIAALTVTLTNGLIGDKITIPSILPGGITATIVPSDTLAADGVMTLEFTAGPSTTEADWTALIQALTFEPSTNSQNNPDPSDRTITFSAIDIEGAASNVATSLIHVVPSNDPPSLDLDDDNSSFNFMGGYNGTFTENLGPVSIQSGVVINDFDDTNLETATISLNNPQTGDELLVGGVAVAEGDTGTVNGISYVVSTGISGELVITLSGSASIADYKSAIEAVEFNNTSENPDPTTRNIAVVVNDGDAPSPVRTAFITVVPVNDAPAPIDPLDPGNPPADPNAVIPAQSGDDGAVLTPLNASVYFADPDDTILTYSLDASAPSWLAIDPDTGEITGTPPSDASQTTNNGMPGSYDVIIIATDPAGLTGQTTAVYSIANPAPDALDDDFVVTEGSALAPANVLTGDNGNGIDGDPDGDALTVSAVEGAPANVGVSVAGDNGGLFTIDANGAFTFVENGEFEDVAVGETRDTVVTYTISDGQGGTDTATIKVTITGTNDAPVVVPGSEIVDATGSDAELITPIDVSTAFNDPDTNDVLIYTAAGLPLGLSLDPNTGLITGTIDPSASQNGNTGSPTDGVYAVTITVDDSNGGIVTNTFTFTIGNPAPDALDDAFAADEDTAVSGENVLANNGIGPDVDPDGDAPLTITMVGGDVANVGSATAGDNGGLFTINSDGSLSFDPNGDFEYLAVGESVTTTITYELSDGEGGVDTATVTYTVNGVNDLPVPFDPLDPVTPPADPNNFIPAQSGQDDQPILPLDVTAYVVDPDASDILTFTIDPNELPLGLTFDGTTISGTLDPNASQGGDDPLNNPGVYLIPVTVTDNNGGSFTTTITYVIDNPPPVAQDDALTGDEDTVTNGDLFVANPTTADSDPDGDVFVVTRVAAGNDETALSALTDGTGVASAVTGSTGGTFTVNDNGTFTFDPGTDFQDLDIGETRVTEIVYQIDDGQSGTDTAIVSYTVTGANDAPVVIDPNDPFPNPNEPPAPIDPDNVIPDQTGNDGAPLMPLDVSPYFVDVDGEALTFGIDPADPDVPSWLSIDPVTGEITGTPPTDASQGGPLGDGVYPITITATDPDGLVVTTTIDFSISNLPPVAVDDVATGTEDAVQTGNVISDPLTGDADTLPDSDPVLVTDVDGTPVSAGSPAVLALTYGELTMNEDGSWSFAPNSLANQLSDTDPAAVEVVTYTIDDGNGGTDTATLTINITGINDPVQVVDPNDPTTDPTDPGYDPLNPTVIGDPDNLILDVAATDGETPTDLDVSPYFGDAEGDTLTFSATDLPSGLTIDPVTGIISGTVDPDASQNGNGAGPGIYEVVIIATDPQNNTATTTITYTVSNIPPTAQDDSVTAPEDGIISGDVFADNGNGIDQDTPPDTDPILVGAVDGLPGNVGLPTPGSNGGSFIINDDGTYTFDPGTDFQDLDSSETRTTQITYTIDDGNGGTDTATLVVTVEGANDAPVIIDPNDPFTNPNEPPVPADPENVIPDIDGSDSVPLAPLDVTPYFYDVDGDPLTLSLDPATTPSWLTIDNNGVISGTPPSDASVGGLAGDGVYLINIIATDDNGAVVSTTVTFTIVNIPPTATSLPDDMQVAGNQYGVSTAEAFADPDGDILAFSATGLPDGLTIDPVTGIINGQVNPAAVSLSPNGDGHYTVYVTADDGQGGAVTIHFDLHITDPVSPDIAAPTGSSALPHDGNTPQGPLPPNLIVDGSVNGIGYLGGNSGLFDKNHPITEALYQISPLSMWSPFDAEGLPVSEMSNWIDATRQALSREPSFGVEYYEGNDHSIMVSGENVLVRTLGWNGVFFIEAISGNQDLDWEVESIDGVAKPGWIQRYGQNLFALQIPAGAGVTRIVLVGSDAGGNETRVELDIGLEKGRVSIDTARQSQQALNFSSQLQAVLNQSQRQVSSLFPKHI